MGQGIGRVPEAAAVGGDADGGREPIGRYIAQQRRLRGIDLEDLAARTRIPRRSLERLEAGAFDHSPDGFSRGFVRTVAEAIGLDADDAVARMLPEPDARRRSSPRANRALGTIAAGVALLALALGARELWSSLSASAPRLIAGAVRRDYVRALAEAHGIDAAKLTARSAVLAPLPAEPPPVIAPDGADALVIAPAPAPAAHAATARVSAGPAVRAPREIGQSGAASLPAPAPPERAAEATVDAEAHPAATAESELASPGPARDAEAHD